MYRFFRREDGVITLYVTIVIVAIFMFNAVLIDYARILAATKQTESAAQAGVRSVLAGYYPSLLDYGLFGVNNTKSQDIFQSVVAGSLPPDDEGYWRYLDLIMNPESQVSFPADGFLSNPSVFQQQVLEEMKYKAPIQLFVDFFRGKEDVDQLEKNMQNDQIFMNITGDVSKFKQERDGYLNELNGIVVKVANQLKSLVKSDINWAMTLDEDPPPTDEQKQDHAEARQAKIDALENNLARAKQLLEAARTANNNLAGVIDANRELLKEYSEDPDKLVLPAEFFTVYQDQIDTLNSLCRKNRLFSDDENDINTLLNRRSHWEDVRKASSFDQTDATKAGQEKAGGLPDVDPSKIDDIANQIDKIVSDVETFRKAADLAENTYGQAASQRTQLSSNKEAAASKASGDALNVVKQMNSMLTGYRDDLWINEYALLHFNCFTTENGQDRLSQIRSRAKLGKEEVEFILYGLPAPKVNTVAAGSAIYVIRFGIQFSYGLRLFQYLIDPKLILIAAATYGAIQAAQDEKILLSGDKVALYPKYKLMLSYRDYLRMFMLLEGRDTKTKRMQALVHLNTGQDLTQTPAYAEGTASTSLRLWFITKPLQVSGKIQGGRYVITRQAAMYY